MEDHPQAFFEEVGTVQLGIGLSDPGELDLLVLGEVLRVLPQRVAGPLEALGQVAARAWWGIGWWASAATFRLCPVQGPGIIPRLAAYFIESVGLGGAQLVRFLTERIARLEDEANELRAALHEPLSDQPGVAALVEDLVGHSQRRVAVEREWTEHVLARLAAGDYHTPPTGPLDDADQRTSTGERDTP